MRKILLMATLLVFVLTSSVWAADISGIWAATIKMAVAPEGEGDAPVEFDIKADGEALTITVIDPIAQASPELANDPRLQGKGTGTLKGDAINMLIRIRGVEVTLIGKMAGNKMSGTSEIKWIAQPGIQGGGSSEQGPNTWTAVKK